LYPLFAVPEGMVRFNEVERSAPSVGLVGIDSSPVVNPAPSNSSSPVVVPAALVAYVKATLMVCGSEVYVMLVLIGGPKLAFGIPLTVVIVALATESVNVAAAVSPDDWPVAVACNVAPMKSVEKMYQLVSNSPLASATTSHGSNDCWVGSNST